MGAVEIPRILDVQVQWADFSPGALYFVPCLICGGFDVRVLASVVINLREFFLVQCTNCGLIWRTPLPGYEFLEQLYSEGYYNVAAHAPQLVWQVGIADYLQEHHQRRSEIAELQVQEWLNAGIRPVCDDGMRARLLEIGGGRGYLQAEAERQGWETLGVEMSACGVRDIVSRGLQCLPVAVAELCLYVPHLEYFDLVAMYDFLEHVTDPGEVLRCVRRLLGPAGIVSLRVPDTQCLPELHLIDHIWHFSRRTLRMLLRKEGFAEFHCHDSGVFEGPDNSFIQNITVFARKE